MEIVNYVAVMPVEIMHFFLSHYLDDKSLTAFPIVCRAWRVIEETHKLLWVDLRQRSFALKNPVGLLNPDVEVKNRAKAVGRSDCDVTWS